MKSRLRLHLRLIGLIGVLVPRRLRRDWRQEWEAELRYRERLLAEWERLDWWSKFDLLQRSLGAFWDALRLQPQRLEDEMFQDLRFGLRMLLKHRGFTLVAILSLGLGIGANTALFSLVDTVLLRSLPVSEPERLVLFEWRAGRDFRTTGMRGSFTRKEPGITGASMFRYDIVEKLQQTARETPDGPLSDLFAFAPFYEVTAVVDEQAEIINGQAVSGNYFNGLRVQPELGRGITEEDDQAAASPVVVLGHKYWQERFAADPGVIGRPLNLNKITFTIIGVTPPEFTSTLQVQQRPEVTVPIAMEPLLLGARSGMVRANKPGLWWINLMGRLKPEATLKQARDSLNATFEPMALEAMPPPRKESDPATLEARDYPRLISLPGDQGLQETRQIYSATLYGLFLIVALVLLIACANVANLLLARAALRNAEISLRLAIGAGRLRLVRQLLTESVLLGVLGGIVGVLFAFWGKSALAAMADRHTGFLPEGVVPAMNWRVLAFTFVISLVTGVLFGLVPAWRATKPDLTSALKQSHRATAAVSRLSKGLVIGQVALSLVLLVGAGAFLRTVYNLQKVNLGFNQEKLLIFALQPQQGGYKNDQLVQFYEQLFTRLDGLPGVRSATFGRVPLISHYMYNTQILLPGETEKSGSDHVANRQMVRENYFSTMEIPLLQGRAFTAHDSQQAPNVAIVNRNFADQYFPGEEIIGKRVTDTDTKTEVEIVGVVGDTKYNSQRQEIEPLLYTPWRQELAAVGEMYFALRTEREPTALASTVRQVVREMDSNLPVIDVSSQEERGRQTLSQERLYARLLSFFGGLALLLAAIGLTGVLAYSVAQRTNEIGVRMALGARPANVLRLVIWQGMKLVLIGLALGSVVGYILQRLLASNYFDERAWQRRMAEQLYGVTLTDPLTLTLIAMLLSGVALLACWLPARRAARVDPLVALRHE